MINMDLGSPVSDSSTDDGFYGSLDATPSTSSAGIIGLAEDSGLSYKPRHGRATINQSYSKDQNLKEDKINDLKDEDTEDFWLNKQAFIINQKINSFTSKNQQTLKNGAKVLAVILYSCYLGAAVYHSPVEAVPLYIGTAFALLIVLGKIVYNNTTELRERLQQQWQDSKGPQSLHYAGLGLMAAITIGVTIFICYDARKRPSNLISVAGLAVFILLGFIFSKARTKVIWRIVVAALLIQFLFGFLIVRWDKGLAAFEWMATQVSTFLFYTDHGTKFVFGEMYTHHEFIMQAMPVVIFFGACIGLLYYWGILQKVIMTIGFFIQKIVGVAPLEAFVSAASIFLDPNASALTVSSFLTHMTISELHCIMSSGFSTVSGSLYGVYLSSGISASSLMAASVMSAPAALGMSKLMCPETEKSKLSNTSTLKFPKSESNSALEAFAHGAQEGFLILIQASINLLAGVALLSFIDGTMTWTGARVGIEDLTFARFTSYLFYPVAFIMGVDTPDCLEVARLLGTKLFLTEIVGYQELGILIKNRELGLKPSVSKRSETIATFALCGFSSFPDIAILLSALCVMAPTRTGDISGIALRAMITGNMSCYLSACVAGLLYTV